MDVSRQVFNIATGDGMPGSLANLIASQAAHETANFTSTVYKSCKNLFGYKYRGQPLASGSCLVSPESDTYARYASMADSVHELTAWIRRRQKEGVFPADLSTITTAGEYAALLKKGQFYGDSVSNYTNGLQRFAFQYRGAIRAGAVIVALGIIYLASRQKKSR